jgi:hypothetical protein
MLISGNSALRRSEFYVAGFYHMGLGRANRGLGSCEDQGLRRFLQEPQRRQIAAFPYDTDFSARGG